MPIHRESFVRTLLVHADQSAPETQFKLERSSKFGTSRQLGPIACFSTPAARLKSRAARNKQAAMFGNRSRADGAGHGGYNCSRWTQLRSYFHSSANSWREFDANFMGASHAKQALVVFSEFLSKDLISPALIPYLNSFYYWHAFFIVLLHQIVRI